MKNSVAIAVALMSLATIAASGQYSAAPPYFYQNVAFQAAGGVPGPSPAPSGAIIDGQTWNAFSPPSPPMGGTPTPGVGRAPVAPLTQTFQPVQPQYGVDPFLAPNQVTPGFQPQPLMAQPFAGQPFSVPGANRADPYRFGWQQRLNFQWLTDRPISSGPVAGDFGQFGLDYEWQWTQQMPGWVFMSRPHYGLRSYDAPTGSGLPSNAHRFGWELRMEVPRGLYPWQFNLSFTPSINSDFDGNLGTDGFLWDNHAEIIFPLGPYWQAVVGYQYWDRLNDRVLPRGGLVYTDDFWEWRLTFPEARISLFLGNEYLWSKWLYARMKYNVEAFEVTNRIGGANIREQMEIEDWRALIGLRMNTGRFDWFLEGGWVFSRGIDFKRSADLSVNTGFIGQIGLRF